MSVNVTALSRGFPRIARQLNYSREFVSPGVVKITVPGGLSYEAFDQFGAKPKLKSLFYLVESARSYSFWPSPHAANPQGSFADFHEVLRNHFFFIATARMEINQSFYKITSPKHPLTITQALTYCGQSSKCLTSVIQCPTNNLPYASCSVQTVLVDPKTRRPTPFPEWWRGKYGQYGKSGSPLIMKLNQKPQTVNQFNLEVCYGDIDHYKHTNWISYVRFCHDACMYKIMKQQYRNLTEDIVENGVKSFEITFKNESNVGDKLQVLSWEDDVKENDLGVNFEIRKSDDVCCYAKMSFHSNKLIQFDEFESKL